MDPGALLLARRYTRVWSDPARKLQTLQGFAATEEDGGRDLELAARRSADPEVRGHFQRHAADELRHAALFRQHADTLRARLARAGQGEVDPARMYDLSRGRRGHEIDAHGFFRAGLCDELGEVAYVAMLHVAEQRAARLFTLHGRLNAADPALAATFEEILRDEKYHVAYTERLLERWRAQGRGREVDEGLRSARSSRFLAAWKRLGLRSAGGLVRMLLLLMYWTLLAPFGLAARAARPAPAWSEREDDGSAGDRGSLASQA